MVNRSYLEAYVYRIQIEILFFLSNLIELWFYFCWKIIKKKKLNTRLFETLIIGGYVEVETFKFNLNVLNIYIQQSY